MALKKRPVEINGDSDEANELPLPKMRRTCSSYNRRVTNYKFKKDQRVEVSMFNEAYSSSSSSCSWHPAMVIDTWKEGYCVRYENLWVFQSNQKRNLVQYLNDPTGVLRPFPPPLSLSSEAYVLHDHHLCWYFGLCVDAYSNGCWSEGVVFSRFDGKRKEIKVFFPESGGGLMMGIKDLRVTQDWDEGLDDWKPRGKWVFLDMIEGFVKEGCYVGVSIQQIWEDLRDKLGFEKIRSWRLNEKLDSLKDTTFEVISYYQDLILKQVLEKRMELESFEDYSSDNSFPTLGEENPCDDREDICVCVGEEENGHQYHEEVFDKVMDLESSVKSSDFQVEMGFYFTSSTSILSIELDLVKHANYDVGDMMSFEVQCCSNLDAFLSTEKLLDDGFEEEEEEEEHQCKDVLEEKMELQIVEFEYCASDVDIDSQVHCSNLLEGLLNCGYPSHDMPINKDMCSICQSLASGDDELICCDGCPSVFHKSCLCFEDVPDSDWFCPSCCCEICCEGKTKKGGSFLICCQCEHMYHVMCLRKGSWEDEYKIYENKFFCGNNCKKMYIGLKDLLWKPIQVGKGILTWTLAKSINDGDFPSEYIANTQRKLKNAISLMHKCFFKLDKELTEDVIFSRGSKMSNNKNCEGFYTVLLERGRILVSVATVRIYGYKVAEVPFVATRPSFCKQGMCRILMNQLEKMLEGFGVERVVLPACCSVMTMWTRKFGYSEMSRLEKLELLDYTILGFWDTIMCQKRLKIERVASPDSVLFGLH